MAEEQTGAHGLARPGLVAWRVAHEGAPQHHAAIQLSCSVALGREQARPWRQAVALLVARAALLPN